MHRNYWAPELQLLKPTPPRAQAPRQETPPQWEDPAPRPRAAPTRPNERKPMHSNKGSARSKINKQKFKRKTRKNTARISRDFSGEMLPRFDLSILLISLLCLSNLVTKARSSHLSVVQESPWLGLLAWKLTDTEFWAERPGRPKSTHNKKGRSQWTQVIQLKEATLLLLFLFLIFSQWLSRGQSQRYPFSVPETKEEEKSRDKIYRVWWSHPQLLPLLASATFKASLLNPTQRTLEYQGRTGMWKPIPQKK